jgi:PAS domain S-box-containing protein
VALALFGVIGLMISGLFEVLGRTRRRLEAKSAALEGQIEQRVRAEEALRASEARHRRLAEANIIGIAVSDSRGRIWDANEAFLEMVGFTREEVQAGKARWDERTPPEYQAVSWKMAKKLQRSGRCPPFEKEYLHPDGRRVSVVMAGAALEGSDQHIAFALDISGRKRAEEALRAGEARLAAILGSTMDAIISVDGAQRIVLFNRAAEQMFRCTIKDAVGQPIDRFIPCDSGGRIGRT